MKKVTVTTQRTQITTGPLDLTSSFQLEGTIFWGHLHQPLVDQDKPDKKTYQLDLAIDDAAVLEQLNQAGVPIKNKDEHLEADGKPLQGNFVTIRSKFKPTLVDNLLKQIPETTLIGNGSTGIVKANLFKYTPRKKDQTGVGLGLQTVQIINLVEFNNPLDGFEVREGTNTSEE